MTPFCRFTASGSKISMPHAPQYERGEQRGGETVPNGLNTPQAAICSAASSWLPARAFTCRKHAARGAAHKHDERADELPLPAVAGSREPRLVPRSQPEECVVGPQDGSNGSMPKCAKGPFQGAFARAPRWPLKRVCSRRFVVREHLQAAVHPPPHSENHCLHGLLPLVPTFTYCTNARIATFI